MSGKRKSAKTESAGGDRLPPHDLAAEQGVLGSVLLDPSCLTEIEERLGLDPEAFFSLGHRAIFGAYRELRRRGQGIDVITVQSALRSVDQLDAVGGGAYISALPDNVPSAAHVGDYIRVVWEKFLARRLVQDSTRIVSSIHQWDGISEGLWAEVDRLHEEWKAKAARGSAKPEHLKRAFDFGAEVEEAFFGGEKEEPGIVLPIDFKHRIRFGETTLVYGDDGCGKSTLLKYFAIHLAAHLAEGERITIASFEEPPKMVLRHFLTMLLGTRNLPDTEAGRKKWRAAFAWLNRKFLFYDFQGIGSYMDLLDTLRYAAEKEKSRIEIVDNMMRLGIADDDYAQQAFCAGSFATHAARFGTHLFFVLHENKGDGKGKLKIRGSKLLSANAWNVWQVEKNDKKGEKVAQIWARIESEQDMPEPNKKAIDEDFKELDKLNQSASGWDTQITLRKQRLDGTRQNSCRRFYFDHKTLQFRTKYYDAATNWLDRWGASAPATKKSPNV
jgi:energy-coupling factor transporter ATP-binding protein EcfA2